MIRAQWVHTSRHRSGDTGNSESAGRVGAEPLQCTGFSDRRGAGKRPKNGAVSGAEVPRMVPFSFPRIVTVFPFLHS
jgi:hypothetical protein